MKKITIGLPKALLYYKYKDLWTVFFNELGFNTITSLDSNQEILHMGCEKIVDEACLSMKLYLGHIEYLKDKCDFILVPRISSLKKKEKLCTNFSALYDLVRNVSDVSILHYNIDVEKNETEAFAFLSLGKQLNCSYTKTLKAYQKAKEIETRKKEEALKRQLKVLKRNSIKILVVSHPYNLYDKLIGEPITKYLYESGVDVIYSDIYDKKQLEEECHYLSSNIYWTYNKELLGAITHYQKQVDGIILLTTFPCGPDSLTNEMCLRKIHGIPITNIIIDELNSETGLITRLESFIDIIKEKKRRIENVR